MHDEKVRLPPSCDDGVTLNNASYLRPELLPYSVMVV